ncbi:uncharacterized protein LOC100840794 isoform X4 [Brachypodium distachyon]|uniref:uncharacterized protein LOC100840794 isoform X4 n=1 Tax=Brachypodium distachyon TaxID=15368 RepID=UPI000D0E2EC0|nr:uncharacterized protein LOC100840794 isoform X4 [Brachypodium distachyon]XP_024311055.1 uncharacterized protein LOC100840794 isoform X4 [Brachypodium distachyon]|eukprot:XP_024311051.1 uncharacterized protein LOC100840794 isoform X4 [Brachypodium distachyon]
MSAAAWRWVWQQPASLSDLWRLTRMAGTSSSRCPSASAGWWPRPAAWKDRSFTMPEPARFYYSAASRVGHLGTANQRPAYLSDPGRTPLFSGHPSAQAMAEVAAWRRPTSPTFSSSRGQASGFIDRMPSPSNPQHLLQFFGASPRSLSESAGWRRRQTAWKGRIFALRKPARLFLSDLGQARQFSTAKQQQRQTTKPHLYLVLDDYKEGFTIHKMDIDIDLNVDCGSAETPGCLPEPPVLRIHYPSDVNFAQISALGSHIIAICPSARLVESGTGATITFDTKTALFSLSRILPRELLFGYEAAIAVRNRLYVFESSTDLNDGANGVYFGGGLHCLAADPNDDERCNVAMVANWFNVGCTSLCHTFICRNNAWQVVVVFVSDLLWSKCILLLSVVLVRVLQDGIIRTAGSILELSDNVDLSRKSCGSSKADKLQGGGGAGLLEMNLPDLLPDPRPHQLRAVNWMIQCDKGILFRYPTQEMFILHPIVFLWILLAQSPGCSKTLSGLIKF